MTGYAYAISNGRGAVTVHDLLPFAVASPAASPQASERNPALAFGLSHTEDAA